MSKAVAKPKVKYSDLMGPSDPLTPIKEMLLREAAQVATDEELKVAEAAYKKAGSDDQSTFNYSIVLVRAKTPALIQIGIAHLKVLYGSLKRKAEIEGKGDETMTRGCLYYVAFGFFRLGRLDESIRYLQTLIAEGDTSNQADALLNLSMDILTYPKVFAPILGKKRDVLSPRKFKSSGAEGKNKETAKQRKEEKRQKEKAAAQKKKEKETKLRVRESTKRKEEKRLEAKRIEEEAKKKELEKKRKKRDGDGEPTWAAELADELLDTPPSSPGQAPTRSSSTHDSRKRREMKTSVKSANDTSTSSTHDSITPREESHPMDHPRPSVMVTTPSDADFSEEAKPRLRAQASMFFKPLTLADFDKEQPTLSIDDILGEEHDTDFDQLKKNLEDLQGRFASVFGVDLSEEFPESSYENSYDDLELDDVIGQQVSRNLKDLSLDARSSLESLPSLSPRMSDSLQNVLNEILPPSLAPPALERQDTTPSNRPWVVIRRFNKRGGKKVQLPESMLELKLIASEKFDIICAGLREAATEAEVDDINAITPDSVLLVLTAEEEADFD